jgi:transcription initiation factor TFIID subunit 8
MQQAKPPSPTPAGPPSAPDIPTISPDIASNEIRRLIVSQLKIKQFDSVNPQALRRLELEVVACTFFL